ncbi:endoglucanase 12, partial [Quercus suber]
YIGKKNDSNDWELFPQNTINRWSTDNNVLHHSMVPVSSVVHTYYFHTREMLFQKRAMLSSIIFVLVSLCFFLLVHGDGVTSIDYAEALNKSLLYYEAQRSGELPIHQRVEWRAYIFCAFRW